MSKTGDKNRAGKRARGWTAIVYLDSVKDGWRDELRRCGYDVMVSPFHDRDVQEDGKTPKKPHHHVVIYADNPITRAQAKAVFDTIGAVMAPEATKPGDVDRSKVASIKKMARYLCHLDDADKATYDTQDVEVYGNINYQALIMTSVDEDAMLDEIEDFIDRHCVISFVTFARWCRKYRPEWKHLIREKKSYYIREYIKANAWYVANEDVIKETEDYSEDVEVEPSSDDKVNENAGDREGAGDPSKRGHTTTPAPRVPRSPERSEGVRGTLSERSERSERSSDANVSSADCVRTGDHAERPSDCCEQQQSEGPSGSTVCEVCGKPAVGGYIGPDGQHLYCDEHRELFDDDDEL